MDCFSNQSYRECISIKRERVEKKKKKKFIKDFLRDLLFIIDVVRVK